MKSVCWKKISASTALVVISFLLGGEILPHLQVRWISGSPAAAQVSGSEGSVTTWARTQPVAVAAERASSAVVNIDTISNVRQQWGFFGEFNRVVPAKGSGSGVIITPDGYILTNDHVIEGANRITVTLANGKVLPGKLIGADHLTDIAVVKIADDSYPFATLGDSSKLRPGEWAIAEGNPLGTFAHTVSLGVVSALSRKLTIGDRTYEDLLQTDAAINPGNSGGPLLDINGNVIGINTATVSSAQGISFAIPINTAKAISQELIQHGKVKRAWSGLQLQDIPARVAATYGLDPHGAIVVGVDEGSPAEDLGFQEGDIIRKVEDTTVESADGLRSYLNKQPINATISILVERGDKQQAVKMKLVEQP